MTSDLKDQIHILMERGIQRLSAADVAGQSAAASPFPPDHLGSGLRSRRTVLIATTVAASACAAGLVAAQLGNAAGPVRPGSARAPVVLTAAMLRHVTSVSRLALAHSGRVIVASREVLGGKLQQTGILHITFDGRNWNAAVTVATADAAEHAVSRASGIKRVVDGNAYAYSAAPGRPAWYHLAGPHAVDNLAIPDPRVLLRELAPAARFTEGGTSVLAGVTVTRLTATNLKGLPSLDSPHIWPDGTVSALTIWVDGRGVVRQVTVTGMRTVDVRTLVSGAVVRHMLTHFKDRIRELERRDHLAPAQAIQRVKSSVLGRELRKEHLAGFKTEADVTTMTIRFTDIGRPQIIRAPAHAIRLYGSG
jgi:hypothetical protein